MEKKKKKRKTWERRGSIRTMSSLAMQDQESKIQEA